MAVDSSTALSIAKGALNAAGLGTPTVMGGQSFILPSNVSQMTPTGSFASSAQINTANSISSIFAASNVQTDFILMGKNQSLPINFLSQVYLQLVISNDDPVNNLELVGGFLTMMYNSLQLLIDGTQVQSFSGGRDPMVFAVAKQILSNMTQSEYDEQVTVYGEMASSNPVTIGPSTTQRFLLPLVPHLFSGLARIPTSSCQSEVRLRINWGPGSFITRTTSTSTAFSMQELNVVAFGQVLPSSSIAALNTAFASSTLRVPDIQMQSRSFVLGALAAGARSTRQIINSRGWLLEAQVGVWSSPPATPDDVYGNLIDPFTSTFYNSASTNVFSGLDNPEIETAIYSRLYFGPGTAGAAASMDRVRYYPASFYEFNFCIKSTGDVTGLSLQRHGSLNLSSQESIDIVPSAICPNAQLFIILRTAASWSLTGGVLSYQVSAS